MRLLAMLSRFSWRFPTAACGLLNLRALKCDERVSPCEKRTRSKLESPGPHLTSRAVISLALGAEGNGGVRGESSVRPVWP